MAESEVRGSWIEYDVIVRRNVMVPMRDGVRLATDLYFPAKQGTIVPGAYPAVIERTPYDKESKFSEGRYLARRGYVAVRQDVRGRFESEGVWHPFAKEAPDGYDTVEWGCRAAMVRRPRGHDGRVVLRKRSERAGHPESAASERNGCRGGHVELSHQFDAAERRAGVAVHDLCVQDGNDEQRGAGRCNAEGRIGRGFCTDRRMDDADALPKGIVGPAFSAHL